MEIVTPPRTSPGRRSGANTADRILDAAEANFARHGYAGTSLRQVASAVGIQIPSLYNHFASKEALYAAVLGRGMAPILELLSPDTAGDEDHAYPDPAETIDGVMALLSQRPNLARLVQYELLAGGEHLAPLLSGWLKPALGRSLELLQKNPAARRWSPEELPYLLLAFFNIVVGHFTMGELAKSVTGKSALSQPALQLGKRLYGQIAASVLRDPDTAAQIQRPKRS